MMRNTFVRAALLAVLAVLAGCRERGSFPERPIVLICPWSAGGGTDRVARKIADQLERELGVPVNVVNAKGGAGVTGHARGAMARPDGYTITLVTAELNMLHWRGLTDITYRDFQPLALVNRDAAALFVQKDAEWKTVGELTDTIRQRPGELSASGTAFGGIWHVALAGWLTHSGLKADDVIWKPISGSKPSLQELLAGGVDVVCCQVAEAQSLLDAGEIRCLAVMADQRSDAVPKVPTLKELGIDWSIGTWRGVAAPKDVPPERLTVLTEAVRRVVTSDEYLTFMRNAGFGAVYEGPEAFERDLARIDEQFGGIFNSPAFQSIGQQRFGPMLFPAVLAVLGIVVLIALAATGLLRRPKDLPPITAAGLGRIALVAAWVILYVLLADTIGFLLVAAALTFAMLWRLGTRAVTAAVIAVVLVPAVYQVFAVHLRVPFPWGWLGW